jgi:Na+/H+ antiporter NhaA
MALPVLTHVAVNAGSGAAGAGGKAMSTDTALALGVITLLGRGAGEDFGCTCWRCWLSTTWSRSS